ncbi:hypothetical protein TR631_33745 [Streptomyces rochei]|uniref:hypothetical protein n=1 Tax=Streptomyces rochei TaxID=1928 RepID=UPI002ACE38A0|nr:hypothetical protein [Streptomyces rochei]WQC16527.1 hypothetical protein TR631_33745 [Streptomyces rochei]
MSSLEDHLKQYASSDSRHNARNSLLDAITKAVAEIETGGGDVDARAPRLKVLAEAYALVVHGKE